MAGLHWSVTVECDGKHVVTIAHNHLSGDPEPNEEAIRTAANHLLAFIGDPHPNWRSRLYADGKTPDQKAIDDAATEHRRSAIIPVKK